MLQVELRNNEGVVTVIWFGRNHIAGIEPGRLLVVEGTLSLQRGRRVIYNPRYELIVDGAGGGAAGSVPGAA